VSVKLGTLYMNHSIERRAVQVGDILRITRGPFSGLFGSCVALSDARVLIAVEMSGQRFNVEMDLHCVDATPPRRGSASSVDGPEFQRRSGS
jgi:hypothetical protein